MRLPPPPLTVAAVAAGVGGGAHVPTLDVARQGDGPRGLTLDAFAAYWGDAAARKRRLLNVVSLSLARTRLGAAVAPPAAVRALDLVAAAWPRAAAAAGDAGDDGDTQTQNATGGDAHMHASDHAQAHTRLPLPASAPAPSPAPEVLLYALMSPAGAYTDWHCDFGGSSVWYHLLSGRKVFLLAPPSAPNLAAFEAWASSPAQGAPRAGRGAACACACACACAGILARMLLTWHRVVHVVPMCPLSCAQRASFWATRWRGCSAWRWPPATRCSSPRRVLRRRALARMDLHAHTHTLTDRLAALCMRVCAQGWPHAVATPADAIALGGNFLHALCARPHTRTHCIRTHTSELPTHPNSHVRIAHTSELTRSAAHVAGCERAGGAPGRGARGALPRL
jgi:hypothetical protein